MAELNQNNQKLELKAGQLELKVGQLELKVGQLEQEAAGRQAAATQRENSMVGLQQELAELQSQLTQALLEVTIGRLRRKNCGTATSSSRTSTRRKYANSKSWRARWRKGCSTWKTKWPSTAPKEPKTCKRSHC